MIMVTVDKTKCDGDGTCVNVCPQAVFKLEGGKSRSSRHSDFFKFLGLEEREIRDRFLR